VTLKRAASLSGMGMMAGLLCRIPAAVESALAVTRQGEPVRWVTLPGGLPGSQVIAVVSHIVGPPAAGAALGLLVGLVAAVAGSAWWPLLRVWGWCVTMNSGR